MVSLQKGIVLQFPDMQLLWQFAQTLACKSIEINTRAYIVICDCTELEINLALTNYRAKILEGSLVKANG